MPVFATPQNRDRILAKEKSALRQVAAHPLREQKFFPAGGRQAGMKHAPIGLSVGQHIPEKQRIARLALVTQIELGEVRFAALKILIEIDEEVSTRWPYSATCRA